MKNHNRKKLMIFYAVACVLIALAFFVSQWMYQTEQEHNQILVESELSEKNRYYWHLGLDCRRSADVSCCLTSVRRMQAQHLKLAEQGMCPEGYKRNMYRCLGSYQWCEPIEGEKP